ncbi:MATE family efflux transporter, partial [Allofournierella sp.]|uniref:MATE family efflux transporter n=1 Tax=Allofournierella sp. TaxID=1940256 RepID=UPI003AB6B0C8
YFASLLRALGNSAAPLVFLAVSALLNIALDLWFVLGLHRGVAGAAWATVIAQYVSGLGIAAYAWLRCPALRAGLRLRRLRWACVKEIAGFSFLTCLQQSVMNLGILLVQGLVNSFGTTVMAAFAAAVKIDSFAYMPVQDFGNAFSTFIAQNFGAQKTARIRQGLRCAVWAALCFCLVVSAAVWVFARPLMLLFVGGQQTAILAEGVRYLRIEGAFYCGIGCLSLLYGFYRALARPGMSVVLTVVSLGTRVALAYLLSSLPGVGVVGIWWSVPIGWALADAVGLVYYRLRKNRLLCLESPACGAKTGR